MTDAFVESRYDGARILNIEFFFMARKSFLSWSDLFVRLFYFLLSLTKDPATLRVDDRKIKGSRKRSYIDRYVTWDSNDIACRTCLFFLFFPFPRLLDKGTNPQSRNTSSLWPRSQGTRSFSLNTCSFRFLSPFLNFFFFGFFLLLTFFLFGNLFSSPLYLRLVDTFIG